MSFRGRGRGRGGYHQRSTSASQDRSFQSNSSSYPQDDLSHRLGPRSSGHAQRGRGGYSSYSRQRDEDSAMGQDGSSSSGAVQVEIDGVHDLQPDSVVQFLMNKAERPVNISNAGHNEQGKLVVQVDHFGQAMTLKKLSGIRMGKNKLFIQPISTSTSSSSSQGSSFSSSQNQSNRIDTLRTVIQSRYDPQSHFLNLEGLDSDPRLIQAGVKVFGSDQRTSKIGPVLCKMIGEDFPNVASISFANNHIYSLLPLTSLPSRVPHLSNLSFQNNELTSYRDIDPFPGKEFKNLRELLMFGNPVRESQIARSGELGYRKDMKKIFPTIQVLDQQPVVAEVVFDLGVDTCKTELPLPIAGSFFDSAITAQTASDFLSKYFVLFDTNRMALMDLYDAQACFSMSVNTSSAPTHTQRYQRTDYGPWLSSSRNLSRITHSDKRISLLFNSPDSIARAFSQFPNTQHPLEDATSKMMVDAFQIGTPPHIQLLIMVHGEFIEEPSKTRRSFDRTFVVAPSMPGSRSAMAGYGYTLLNDVWVIRAYHSKPEWTLSTAPTPTVVPPQLGDMNAIKRAQTALGLNQVQHDQVVEFARHTGLNYPFSAQCLRENQWNPSLAMTSFQQARPNIPQVAFMFQSL